MTGQAYAFYKMEVSCVGKAVPDIKEYSLVKFETNPTKELEFNSTALGKYIPLTIPPTQDPEFVIKAIGDQTIQSWLKSDSVKSSRFGQTATKVENSMRAEMVVKSIEPKSVEHKFSFQFQPFQAFSKLEYKGWANASVIHETRTQVTGIEVKEKLWNKEFFLNRRIHTADVHDTFGVRWSW